jgi:hypothetical protein
MMVVVFGYEETEVHDGHRLAQARMQRGAREVGGSHAREPFHEAKARGAKRSEKVGDRAMVMRGLVRLAILEIGRGQLRSAVVVIVQPRLPQRFEIEEMSGILLDGPLALVLAGENFGRQSANGIGQAFRRAPEPLEKFGSRTRPKTELELAVEPTSLSCHYTRLQASPRQAPPSVIGCRIR